MLGREGSQSDHRIICVYSSIIHHRMCTELWEEKDAIMFFKFQRILSLDSKDEYAKEDTPKMYCDIFGKVR